MPTRQQSMLTTAAAHVQQAQAEAGAQQDFITAYGGLCHGFPIFVRTNGLCQAVAFLESKAAARSSHRERAHGLFLDQVAANLGAAAGTLPSVQVAALDTVTYIRQTRLLLQRAVFYKRFAVSILKVEGREDE